MPVVVMSLTLSLPGARSLKDKRQVVKSLKERLKQRFNVSVAEMDLQDIWQSAVLGVAIISPDSRFAASVASKVADFVRSDHRLSLGAVETEAF